MYCKELEDIIIYLIWHDKMFNGIDTMIQKDVGKRTDKIPMSVHHQRSKRRMYARRGGPPDGLHRRSTAR